MPENTYLSPEEREALKQEIFSTLHCALPGNVVSFDAEKAEAYRTVPGRRDYYAWGDHVLQLHSDENGTLVSIILTE